MLENFHQEKKERRASEKKNVYVILLERLCYQIF